MTAAHDGDGQASTLLADVSLVFVAVMWGGSYLAAQVMTHVAPPAAVLAMRFLPSLAVLALAAAVRRAHFTRRIVRVGLALGVWQAVTLLLETTAVSRTSATNAGVLVCLAVVIGPALEGALARRRLPVPYFVATACSLVGVAMLLGPSGLTRPRLGDLLVLCAAFTRAGLMVSSSYLTKGRDFDAVAMNTIQTLLNAVVFTVVAGPALGRSVARLDEKHWWVLAFLSLGCTCAAFLLQLWAIHQTSATRASLLQGTEPVWALAAGVLLAGDRPGVLGLVGAVVVIASTFWGQRIESRWRASLA